MIRVGYRLLILFALVTNAGTRSKSFKMPKKLWLTSVAYIHLGCAICMLREGCSLADLQQFFTGKLYVLMYQLKLPAEELLWSALSCTEDPFVPQSGTRIMAESHPVSDQHVK